MYGRKNEVRGLVFELVSIIFYIGLAFAVAFLLTW